MKKELFLILLNICSFLVFSQSGSEKDFNIGKAYEDVHEYAKAVEYYERSWNARPSPETAKKIAYNYFKIKEYSTALLWQEKVMKKLSSSEEHEFFLELLLLQNQLKKTSSYLIKFSNCLDENYEKKLKQKLDTIYKWREYRNGQLKEVKSVNTTSSEVSPIFLNQKLVFATDRENVLIKKKDRRTGESFYNMYSATGSKVSFGKSKNFSPLLNSSGHESSMCFSHDYLDIYFTRVENSQSKDSSATNRMKIFRSSIENSAWHFPYQFLMNDSLYSFGQPYISRDGNLFFFVSDLPGGYGGSDIYVSRKLDSINWSKPVNLGPTINTEGNEMNPSFDKDFTFYFSSNAHNSIGGYDLFSSELIDGKWKVPQNLKFPINSTADDLSIHWVDLNHAYLSSNRTGGTGGEDIYYFTKF